MTTVTVMASSTHALLLCSSSPSYTSSRPSVYSLSSSATPISCPKTTNFHLSTTIPQLGSSLFSQWSGLKHLGISVTPKSVNLLEKKRRCKRGVFYASLFGVARNLGKTLRAFQPTIRELQDVSREFKSTLEREIGLDDISTSTQNPNNLNRTDTMSTPPSVTSTEDSQTVADPNGAASANKAYTSEEYLKMTEEQLKASAAHQQEQSPQGESLSEPQTQPQDTAKETPSAVPPPQKPKN
ncbi:hypothetical protein CUMW_056940 [Citrus unshiu]|nr:hypothetical protein CUMW_056940 [Citrus unshiu]